MTDYKSSYWQERNARRRHRYHNDPEYREAQLAREREKRVTPLFDPRSRKEKLFAYCTPYMIEDKKRFTMSVQQLSVFLNRSEKSVRKWIDKGLFPAPPHMIAVEKLRVSVYYANEVSALINVLGDHLSKTPYYGAYHTEVRERLFAAMESVDNE